ncbi:uncharacterized protein N7498_006599 [Penicillium cinerascens]|uniref:BZIP domain-containing protein n=1 Tax=Penicillium cinerascens TaxID=70096 RepID=A0A9W9SXR0_9EURO|nr:uncharacterized protein N7498_006599 [Penicillium cinerascens]KAJ5201936.1 hypothetical protein N7498_006599 [Penicillium cinerascens]
MSQEPRRTGPLPDDVTTGGPSVIDNERPPAGNRHLSRRPPLRARPQSWHPYGPVEPPLELSSARSIGVHAILNPPEQAAAIDAASSSREPLTLPGPSASPRPRQGSSPAPRTVHPLVQQQLSPRSYSRSLMSPGSPSVRFIGSGKTSAQSSVAHSPLVHQEPFLGPPQPTSSSSLLLESALRPINSLPSTQPQSLTSIHSTAPSVHSRRTSNGPGPFTTPASQEISPTTPHSSFGHFTHASPAGNNVSLPPTVPPYSAAPTYMTMDTMARGTPAIAEPRRIKEEPVIATGTSRSVTPLGGTLIPCVLDLKSGSSSQAEKRKANSDASRRFRNRKRNEVQLEQRLGAQQDEIQRHVETIGRQSEEIRSLAQQRDHYRSERDFYRDQLGRSVQLPPRPPSPRSQTSLSSATDSTATSTWAGDMSRTTAAPTSGTTGRVPDSARPQGSWPGSPHHLTRLLIHQEGRHPLQYHHQQQLEDPYLHPKGHGPGNRSRP